jgi:hypothetical protein
MVLSVAETEDFIEAIKVVGGGDKFSEDLSSSIRLTRLR